MSVDTTEATAEATVPRKRVAKRAPKLDAVLADAVDFARSGLLEIADPASVGAYRGSQADGERLVTHRFEARLRGYSGWDWFATLARVARGKEPTICEVGILPSEAALLAPQWLPWSERVRDEDTPQDTEVSGAEPTEPPATS